jgi:hypothetical protein
MNANSIEQGQATSANLEQRADQCKAAAEQAGPFWIAPRDQSGDGPRSVRQ